MTGRTANGKPAGRRGTAARAVRVAALCLAIALLALSIATGALMNYLLVLLMASTGIAILTLIVSAARGNVRRIRSGTGTMRLWLARGLLRSAAWILTGACVHLAILPVQFAPDEYATILITAWVCVAALCVLGWIPRREIGRATDAFLCVLLAVAAHQLVSIHLPPPSGARVGARPPFEGEWHVVQGGNAALINHHRFAGSQRYALDLILPEDGVLPSRGVTDLDRYRTYGAPLHAPVTGTVVAAEGSLPDLAVGDADPRNPAGNHVVLRTAAGLFVLMAHLQRDSVAVAVGDEVEAGQALARIGNSGNTSQPHLHIQAMTEPDFLDPDSRPVPLAVVTGDGAPRLLVRNDSVSGR